MRLAEAERAHLVDLLGTLSPEQWDAPSLCEGWRVRDVVAHIVSFEDRPAREVAALLVRGGLRFDRVNELAMAELRGLSPVQLVTKLGAHLRPRGLTVGFGGRIALTDGMIHQQDIRRPLGLQRTIPAERMRPVLGFALRSPTLPGWRIARGLRLVATDLDWARGRGPDVRGSSESLLMSVAGRRGAVEECTGSGVGRLRSRIGGV